MVSLSDKGHAILDNLRQLGTPVLPCLGSVHGQGLHPINLYHKVGHGSIDLYVLSPLSDAKDTNKSVGGPKWDQLSSAFLVAWKPASAHEKLTRILFPGNTSQAKIFEGLDRLKTVALFQNILGVVEKIQGPGKGVEKSAAVGAKPSTVKAKPPSGPRPETKDVKKLVPLEQKPSTEQHKQAVQQKAQEPKEAKKAAGDVKETKKAIGASSNEAKNGKAVGSIKKEKESPVKANPPASRIAKRTEGGDGGGKGTKKATSKQPPAAAGATAVETGATAAGEVVKGEEKGTDESSAMPAPSEVDDPLGGGGADLSQVQALPDPTAPEEQSAEEAAMQDDDDRTVETAAEEAEEEEEEKLDEDSLAENDEDSAELRAKGDGQNVAAGESSFDPSKEWGVPEGLPAPVNGKEPGAATAKKTSQSASVVGAAAAADAKKPDTSRNTTETKTSTKRPTTAPERPNNATREEDDKVAPANQSMAKGRPSLTSAHREGASSARVDLKKPKPVAPFYVDVAYIPGHGSLQYFDVDFFRRVRARHYVLSSISPNVKALALLVEGKQAWEDSGAEVSIIPTYDSEQMLSWIHENKDQLQKLNIKIGPPAYKCTMQLQELDTSCASYRLEF